MALSVEQNTRRAARRHVELSDQREPFQRDRDRILYSSAFRRLSGVTQVVAPQEGHIFHNRLTHTLEVAQIARRLAEKLISEQSELADAAGGVNADVVEAAALAHDLGHPPFGHIAEKELDSLLREKQIADGYEGNAQSFRILTKLSVRNADFYGLNLTRATMDAVLKYPWFRGVRDHKWGAYQTEEQHFYFARDGLESDNRRPSVEAQIMTWADDIAYSIHDTEDFYKAGLIPLDRLAVNETGEADMFLDAVANRWEAENRLPNNFSDLRGVFHNFCDWLPVREPYSGTRKQRLALRSFTSGRISEYVQKTRLREPGGPLLKPITIDDNLDQEIGMVKELTWHYVITNPSLAHQQYGQRKIIRTLFEIFHEALDIGHPRLTLLPPRYKEEVQDLQSRYGNHVPYEIRLRTVADIIAGMTDIEATKMYQRLCGIASGSVLDRIVSHQPRALL